MVGVLNSDMAERGHLLADTANYQIAPADFVQLATTLSKNGLVGTL